MLEVTRTFYYLFTLHLYLIGTGKPNDVDRMLLRTTTATVSCGDPPVVNNSQLQLTGHEVGDMVIYQCSLGYQLSGNRSARCQVSGQWSATPLCQGQ